MKNNPVGWFEIYVDDMNRAKTFYETVFETKLEKLPAGDLEMWNFPMECSGTYLPAPPEPSFICPAARRAGAAPSFILSAMTAPWKPRASNLRAEKCSSPSSP